MDKQYLGIETIKEYSKEDVLFTRKSISEIAYELSFQYPQHLTRMFKKFVGMPPNEYWES